MECRNINTRPGSAPKNRINSSVAHACSFSLSCFCFSFLSITELQLSNFYQSSIPWSCSQCPLGKSNPTVGSRVVLVRVFQRNWIDRQTDCQSMGSCDYRGWEAPQSALRKLENQENWWFKFHLMHRSKPMSQLKSNQSKFFLYSICHMCSFIFICVDIWSFVSSIAYSLWIWEFCSPLQCSECCKVPGTE